MSASHEALIGKSLQDILHKGGFRQTEPGVVAQTDSESFSTSEMRAETVIRSSPHVVVLPQAANVGMEAARWFEMSNLAQELRRGSKIHNSTAESAGLVHDGIRRSSQPRTPTSSPGKKGRRQRYG